MNNKSNTPDSNNTSAADDILRQFHPELFHKRKVEEGKGPGGADDFVEQRSSGPATQTPPPANKQVANIHAKPKKVRKQSPSILSPGDLLYKLTNFIRDAVDAIATLAAGSFLRYIINIYVVIAMAILIPSGYAAYKWYNQPPFFIAEECYNCFTEVHKDYFRLRSANASEAEWNEFIADRGDEIEDMVYNLKNTSDVRQRERQVLMWMGEGYLLPMIKKKTGDIAREEDKFDELMSELNRIRRDREREALHTRY
ncbi:hypothetical protein Pla110_30120 [Polystyrenella longa]|uniref:Uncharacterized protein n=1 Tax=Polystyrenella longa TaxID=2528007 RepID=A0A518CPW9_9PLAN|nr:hypothetical protein [Polystyrenella longa]QDU81271.1 hypothetical protein Pla110_30120 [Polystyrenella longa]